MTKSTSATVGSVASLTGHLTKATNPVRAFLGDVLPAESAKPFNDAIRSQLGGGPRVVAARLAPWEHSLIGTAFDYRMRYWFDVPTTKPLVAAYGLLTLDPLTTIESSLRAAGEEFFERLPIFLRGLKPGGRRLDMGEEVELDRHCLVLALLDQVYRVGLRPGSPLMAEPWPRSADQLLAIARNEWLDDLREMAWLFDECAGREGLAGRPTVLNPTFEGSGDMSGADADLIVGDCLIEIKSTIQLKLRDPVLLQLLGYVLLDYFDEYCIRSVGLYLARHGVLLRWSLTQLIGSAGDIHSLRVLRERFRALLRSPLTVLAR